MILIGPAVALVMMTLIFHIRNFQTLLFGKILIFVKKLISYLVVKKSSSILTFYITRLLQNVNFFTIAEIFKTEDYSTKRDTSVVLGHIQDLVKEINF